MPLALDLLRTYDRLHGTRHAENAVAAFTDLAAATISAKGLGTTQESPFSRDEEKGPDGLDSESCWNGDCEKRPFRWPFTSGGALYGIATYWSAR
jgi:hypothetical protein